MIDDYYVVAGAVAVLAGSITMFRLLLQSERENKRLKRRIQELEDYVQAQQPFGSYEFTSHDEGG